MDEKRIFDRYDVNVPVKVKIKNRDGTSEIIQCEAINLAAGGILIERVIALPAGSEVKLEVEFQFEDLESQENPNGTLIMFVTGHVVRLGPETTAIHFDEDYEMSQCIDFLRKEHS
ncbi:MAG: hypothetical protein CVU61_01130 [Deltaproteobacteria bacterium HGW-Deltaproteobacteria-19]|jgi:hypothetical protein|nr:MAG: hypothetical protein CVU61_01130 [Deltaproteobacteria bacterium HGW-Deltaproteobacteria-19]